MADHVADCQSYYVGPIFYGSYFFTHPQMMCTQVPALLDIWTGFTPFNIVFNYCTPAMILIAGLLATWGWGRLFRCEWLLVS